mgnify:CR=1 FL=1
MSAKKATARNHTATHLLQAALKRVLGAHVNQAGSSVSPERLRFDFSHFEPVTAEQMQEVEKIVNNVIFSATDVEIFETSQDEAKAMGAYGVYLGRNMETEFALYLLVIIVKSCAVELMLIM